MARRVVTLSLDLLPEASRARFDTLLTMVARRSVVGWELAPAAEAELVVAQEDAGIQTADRPRCIAVVGALGGGQAAPQGTPTSLSRRFTLRSDFTAGQLLDMLDLAAVWLLDQRSRIAAKSAAPQDDDGLVFQLLQWPPVSRKFSSAGDLRALALLTSGPVSLTALCAHTGLEASRVRDLLTELSLSDLLHVADDPARRTAASDGARAVGHRLMAKMSRWLDSERASACP